MISLRSLLGIKKISKEAVRLIENTGFGTIAMIVTSLIGLYTTAIVARYLGVEHFGLFTLVVAWVTLFFELLDLRVWEAATRYITEYRKRCETDRLLSMVKLSYILELLTASTVFLILLFGVHFFDWYIAESGLSGNWISIFSLGLFFTALDSTSSAVLRALNHFKLLMSWQIFSAINRAVIVSVFLYLESGIEGVIWGYVLSSLISSCALLVISNKILIGIGGKYINARLAMLNEDAKEIKKMIFHTSLGSFWGALIKHVDVIILGHYTDASDVGVYKIAKTYASQFARMADPIYQALFPLLSQVWVTKSRVEYFNFINKISLVLAFLCIPLAAAYWFLAPYLIELAVGKEYLGFEFVIGLMLVGALIAIVFVWVRPTVIAAGLAGVAHMASAVGAVIYVLGSLVIVPIYYEVGSGIMLLANYIVGHGIILFYIFIKMKNCRG